MSPSLSALVPALGARVAGAVLLISLSACAGGTSPPAGDKAAAPAAAAPVKAGAVDVAGLDAAMKGGKVVLYDVRTPGEYAAGHVPGAVNLPLDQLSSRMDELAPHTDEPLYLICASGNRSGRAQAQLAGAGFAHTINVEGGTRAWQAAGKPVE